MLLQKELDIAIWFSCLPAKRNRWERRLLYFINTRSAYLSCMTLQVPVPLKPDVGRLHLSSISFISHSSNEGRQRQVGSFGNWAYFNVYHTQKSVMIISEQDNLACRFIHVISEPRIPYSNLPLLLSSGHTESPSIPPLTKRPWSNRHHSDSQSRQNGTK